MTLIKLIDARRGLSNKCNELFRDKGIAQTIYQYLCDGIEDCEYVELSNTQSVRQGWWRLARDGYMEYKVCSVCAERTPLNQWKREWESPYCPNCGAVMRMEEEDETAVLD